MENGNNLEIFDFFTEFVHNVTLLTVFQKQMDSFMINDC